VTKKKRPKCFRVARRAKGEIWAFSKFPELRKKTATGGFLQQNEAKMEMFFLFFSMTPDGSCHVVWDNIIKNVTKFWQIGQVVVCFNFITDRIHVWYIYLHSFAIKFNQMSAKNIVAMDPMDMEVFFSLSKVARRSPSPFFSHKGDSWIQLFLPGRSGCCGKM